MSNVKFISIRRKRKLAICSVLDKCNNLTKMVISVPGEKGYGYFMDQVWNVSASYMSAFFEL